MKNLLGFDMRLEFQLCHTVSARVEYLLITKPWILYSIISPLFFRKTLIRSEKSYTRRFKWNEYDAVHTILRIIRQKKNIMSLPVLVLLKKKQRCDFFLLELEYFHDNCIKYTVGAVMDTHAQTSCLPFCRLFCSIFCVCKRSLFCRWWIVDCWFSLIQHRK